MSKNQSLRITPMQFGKQPFQRKLLSRRPGIHRSLAVGSQSPDITNTDRMTVMVTAMRTDDSLRSSDLDSPVSRDDIMIPTPLPTKAAMIAVYVRHSQGTARLVGGAVHDNQRNPSHGQRLAAIPPAAPEIINSRILTK